MRMNGKLELLGRRRSALLSHLPQHKKCTARRYVFAGLYAGSGNFHGYNQLALQKRMIKYARRAGCRNKVEVTRKERQGQVGGQGVFLQKKSFRVPLGFPLVFFSSPRLIFIHTIPISPESISSPT